MTRFLLILFFTSLFSSCYVEREENLYVVSGKLIDSTHHKSFAGYKMYAISTIASREKELSNTTVDEEGNFKISYYIKGEYFGNDLKIALIPSTPLQYKFQFLPLGENWHKNFYVGDSALLKIKIDENLTASDTFFIYTASGDYAFLGPTADNTLGTIRLTNSLQDIYFRKNKSKTQVTSHYPTGDPIVDTITLEINP